MVDFDNKEKVEQVLSLFRSLSKSDMAKTIPLIIKESQEENNGDNLMTTQL